MNISMLKGIIGLAKAKKETPKWRVIYDLDAPLSAPGVIVAELIFENNDAFRAWRNPIRPDEITIECKNKPRNSAVYGISFEPYKN